MKIDKLKKIVFLGLLLSLVTSCVIRQEIYFKKDFSGTYKYTFDFKEYANMMNSEESDSTMLKNEDFVEYLESVKTALNEIQGISNIKTVNDADNGLVYYSFDFSDVKALNETLKFSGNFLNEKQSENPPYFIQKKKNLTFIRPAAPIQNTSEDGEDLSYMNDFFKWVFSIQFEQEVKKYNVQKDTAVKITENNHKFTEFGNIYQTSEKNVNWQFKTK